jgi:hydroxymethylglutaryl-CoA reductase (NADPH)
MASSSDQAIKALNSLNADNSITTLLEHLKHKGTADLRQVDFLNKGVTSGVHRQKRVAALHAETGRKLNYLAGEQQITELSCLEGKIENYIGMTQVPTGVIGPLHILGASARGDFYVPLATSEGALVASYHRGAKATRMCGGITSVCLVEGVQRSPVFKFADMAGLGRFVIWVLGQIDTFKLITTQNSNHARLKELKANIEGNHLILTFEFLTGDAAGQNMVTLCTDQICKYMLEHTPEQPAFWYIEGNYSGDKKATAISFSSVRGRKVTAEALISKEVLGKVLKTNAGLMAQYWQTSTIGVIQSGAIGAQGHFANGLAALFIATGQDAACVAEASNGITRMEAVGTDLYVSVTLPSLILGTVGGGTSLPTQNECLELMDCNGPGKARKFAEICGALVLAGEVSIAAALSAGHFSRAHKLYGRKRNKPGVSHE